MKPTLIVEKRLWYRTPVEIIFEVTEDPIDGGFVASALGHGITTEADTLTDLRQMVKDAVQCHFHDAEQMPKIIRLHFVRDEVLSLWGCRAPSAKTTC